MNTQSDGLELVLDAPADSHAAARSRLYVLLAEVFAYPQGSPVIRLLDGDWLADLSEALAQSPLSVQAPTELVTHRSKNAIQEMQVTYTQLFDVTSGTPLVSLLERRYGEKPEQKLWENLLNFYSHFGLDFSQGYAVEQPDHLLTELGFMHYLSFLETGTQGEPDKDNYRRGQRDFLDLHLGSWIGAMSKKLSETEQPHPYAVLASLLAEVVDCDLRYLGECLPSIADS